MNSGALSHFIVAFCLKLTKIKKTRTHKVTRRSRDRQGRVSVRRLGLVYTGGGVLRGPFKFKSFMCVWSCLFKLDLLILLHNLSKCSKISKFDIC